MHSISIIYEVIKTGIWLMHLMTGIVPEKAENMTVLMSDRSDRKQCKTSDTCDVTQRLSDLKHVNVLKHFRRATPVHFPTKHCVVMGTYPQQEAWSSINVQMKQENVKMSFSVYSISSYALLVI